MDAHCKDFCIEPYTDLAALAWESMINVAPTATFLHSRHYLSYHGTRFKDESVVLYTTGSARALIGCLPAARDPRSPHVVISHPGITYGGLLSLPEIRGETTAQALRAIARHYRNLGLTTLRYKTVPWFYHSNTCQDDTYGLFRLGARLFRRDITSFIDLREPSNYSPRRKRSVQRAHRHALKIVTGAKWYPSFWSVLESSLQKHHSVNPVHTLSEMELLQSRFPEHIQLTCALADDELVAGAVLYYAGRSVHIQYIAASPTGREIGATDALIDACIDKARQEQRKFFDFGISTENDGMNVNSSLLDYKSSFGAASAVCDFYELDLAHTR